MRSIFLAFASLSIVAIACSAPSSDDASSSDDALTGSLSEATACLVKGAYEAASVDDITPLFMGDLPATVRPKVPATAITYGKLTFGSRDAYLVEIESELRFYDNRGLELARATKSGSALRWSGPTGAALGCDAPQLDASTGADVSVDAGPVRQCITTTKIDATQFPYAPAKPAMPGECTRDEAKAISSFYTQYSGQPWFTLGLWKGSVTPRCAECAFGIDTAAAVDPDERWAPIMMTATRSIAGNTAGCIERTTSVECARAYEQAAECKQAACKFTCTTQAEYSACQVEPSLDGIVCADAMQALRAVCPADVSETERSCKGEGPYTWDVPVLRACVGP